LVWQGQVDDAVHAIWVKLGQAPHDVRTPIVAHERRVVVPVVVEQRNEITRQLRDVIVSDVSWLR